jgi:hypothetical protein
MSTLAAVRLGSLLKLDAASSGESPAKTALQARPNCIGHQTALALALESSN